MCNGSKLLFIRCLRDTRFLAGRQLRTTTSAVNATTRTAYQSGCVAGTSAGGAIPSVEAMVEVSITLAARTIVTQFNHAKFPDSTSQNWVTAMIAAATLAIGCGANNPNGTTSCAK